MKQEIELRYEAERRAPSRLACGRRWLAAGGTRIGAPVAGRLLRPIGHQQVRLVWASQVLLMAARLVEMADGSCGGHRAHEWPVRVRDAGRLLRLLVSVAVRVVVHAVRPVALVVVDVVRVHLAGAD